MKVTEEGGMSYSRIFYYNILLTFLPFRQEKEISLAHRKEICSDFPPSLLFYFIYFNLI